MKKHQSGVALITVMIVVAAAVVLAVQMTTEQSLAVSRASHFINSQQVMEYALGGEELARQILAEDIRTSPGKDVVSEAWGSGELTFPFEGGTILLAISDLQGRFNLNSLSMENPEKAVAQERFGNLLRDLSIDPVFVDRMADWIDVDDSKGLLGAEDFDYLGLERPYRSAGHSILDVSELRLLLEMDNDTFRRLSPFVAAIPDVSAPININTASPELIKALVPSMSLESAEAIAKDRDLTGGFDDIAMFASRVGGGLNSKDLGVQSGFFEVRIVAQVNDRFAYLTSIIQRGQDGSMRVIFRDMSKKISPDVTGVESDNG